MPFPITCTACGKAFSIADDVYERKVKGRVVTIKCKQCQAGIRIDDAPHGETKDAGTSGSSPKAPLAPAAAVQSDDAPPAPAEIAKAEIAKAEIAKAETAKAETAKAETAKAEIAKAETAPLAPKAAAAASPAADLPKASDITPERAPSAAKHEELKLTPKLGLKVPTAKSTVGAATLKATLTGAAPKTTSLKTTLAATPRAQTAPTPLTVAAKGQPERAGSIPGVDSGSSKTPAILTRSPTLLGINAPKPEQLAAAAASIEARSGMRSPTSAATPKAIGTAKSSPLTAMQTAEVATPATPAAAVQAPPPIEPVSEVLWAVDYPDGEDRELAADQVRAELAAGTINETTLIWREGMTEWLELGRVPEFEAAARAKPPPARGLGAQRALAASAPDLPAPRAPAPLAPNLPEPPPLRPRAASAPNLPEPPPQRPRLPSTPKLPEPEPLAPRGAAAAGFPGAAPAFSPFATPIEIPQVAVGAQPLRGLGAPSFPPVPGAASAPFAAQPAFPIAATPLAIGPEEWPKKSRAPLIIGVIVGLAAIGGGAFFVLNSNDTPTPAVPISALPAAAPTSAPKIDTPSAAPTPATTSNDDGNGTPPQAGTRSSRSAIDPPNSPPATTPNAGFAELFANGARRADEKGAPTQRFDEKAARAAVAAAAASAASCHQGGGPTGQATVVVTFESSGKVSGVTVDPPFAGTSSGACIIEAMKRATVPPFGGLPGTVSTPISLR